MLINHWLRRTLLIAVCAGVVINGCSFLGKDRGDPAGCDDVAAVFARSGFAQPIKLGGKATVDANQHRLNGKMALETNGTGGFTFEFTSSILFGAQREDFVFALVSDTLRIIDRERGMFYEGADAEFFLQETFGLDFSVTPVLKLALGALPDCEALTDLHVKRGGGSTVDVSGTLDGEDFDASFDGPSGRLTKANWPVGQLGRVDRLAVGYEWRPDALHKVEMTLQGREWRCRLIGSN